MDYIYIPDEIKFTFPYAVRHGIVLRGKDSGVARLKSLFDLYRNENYRLYLSETEFSDEDNATIHFIIEGTFNIKTSSDREPFKVSEIRGSIHLNLRWGKGAISIRDFKQGA
jgi:hypothetical protein